MSLYGSMVVNRTWICLDRVLRYSGVFLIELMMTVHTARFSVLGARFETLPPEIQARHLRYFFCPFLQWKGGVLI
jgi:hypothetical protein